MSVAVVTDVSHIVATQLFETDSGRAFEKSVGIVKRRIAIVIEQDDALRRETLNRQVLAIHVEQQQIFVTRRFRYIVQAGVEIFFQRAKVGDVVLPAVIVAISEKAHARFAVLKQETAKVAREGLNADAYFVEIETLVDSAEVFQKEEFLHAEETVVAIFAETRVDLCGTHLLHVDAVVVQRERRLEFVLGRLECRVAFVVIGARNECLTEDDLIDTAKHIVLTRVATGIGDRPASARCAAAKRNRK